MKREIAIKLMKLQNKNGQKFAEDFIDDPDMQNLLSEISEELDEVLDLVTVLKENAE